MSEITTVITSGFASIAGNVFALYVSLGINASFLLAASAMSAPAAIVCSKLVYPETMESKVD
jgi:nucleoside permease NupC